MTDKKQNPKSRRSLFSRTDKTEQEPTKKEPAVIAIKADKNQSTSSHSTNTRLNTGLNITQLRESFDAQAPNRSSWAEEDYTELIHRLDKLQTEAFILKGKLLSEAKEKFFATNKIGWATFCNEKLGMNYTTANQYARVALEFDVTSHQYPTLGFEHFKALLPIEPSERKQVLDHFSGGSVKALRNIVAEKIGRPERFKSVGEKSTQSAKQLLKSLQIVHMNLASVDAMNLSTQVRWQLFAACNQVARSLLQFSAKASDQESFNESLREIRRPDGATVYNREESENFE